MMSRIDRMLNPALIVVLGSGIVPCAGGGVGPSDDTDTPGCEHGETL
jgi:hypothetical protein